MKISTLVINITDVEDALMLKNYYLIELITSYAEKIIEQGGKIIIQREYANAAPDILVTFSTIDQIKNWVEQRNSK